MLSLLTDFVGELRRVGIPVSMVEAIDAMEAVSHIDLGDRDALKATLGATMVKNSRHQSAFDTAFEVYFSVRRHLGEEGSPVGPSDVGPASAVPGPGGSGQSADLDVLIEALLDSLVGDHLDALRGLARRSVDQLAGIEPGRPVGGTYYLYRTLRQLDIEALEQRLLQALMDAAGEIDELEERLLIEEVEERINQLREEIQAEIRRRLVEDRGHEAVARTLRKPLIEELDLMHAGRTDIQQMEKMIEPLTRKLAARLAQRRRLARTGRLDFRKTVRASLGTGGVPIEPKFKTVRPHKPEIILLCDISGSMATFARFTLQFTYAMATQFSRLRSFVFVDAVDEVTRHLRPGVDFADALARIASEADVVWLDGHSDYGHAFEQFSVRFAREVTAKSTIIIAGDARNNYREPRAGHLGKIAASARAVYWLNPEPRAYWDSGDSVMSRYAPMCDEVFEVRNLRQLEGFVEKVADRPIRTREGRFRSIPSMTVPMSGG